MQPCDLVEVGVCPVGVFHVGCVEFADDGAAVRVADEEGGFGEFDEVGGFFAVGVGDEDGGTLQGLCEVAHAGSPADAAGGGDVPVGEGGAGAGVGVHVGSQGHVGRYFSAVEGKSFHVGFIGRRFVCRWSLRGGGGGCMWFAGG